MRTLTAFLVLLAACAKQAPPAPSAPASATAPASAARESGPRVVLPNGFVVQVEAVADPELRAQGLMFRDRLARNAGMLFFFPADGDYGFWMKNTLIPLDIIWIDSTRRIVHIKHDVPPCKVADCPSYPPGVNARYVLELAAGVAREQGLREGDVLRFLEMDGVVARE